MYKSGVCRSPDSTSQTSVRNFQTYAQDDTDGGSSRERLSGKVVLIADDDEFFRMALQVILTEWLGFSEVVEANSLEEAIEQLSRRDDIELALFDLAMPGMKSAASLREIREKFSDSKIAVISGSKCRDDVLLALTSGVHGYVPKSLGASNIQHALAFILGGQVYVPQLITELDHDDVAQESSKEIDLRHKKVTKRQKEVLSLVVQGRSNKEIARILDLGEGTVKVHMSALFRNLGTKCRSATAAVGAQILAS